MRRARREWGWSLRFRFAEVAGAWWLPGGARPTLALPRREQLQSALERLPREHAGHEEDVQVEHGIGAARRPLLGAKQVVIRERLQDHLEDLLEHLGAESLADRRKA